MSGVQLEQLLGHLTFISLGKREVLSIFGDSYTFVKRHYHDIAPIWKSVRKELLTWCRVSPLIVQDLRSEWSSEISAVDASEWGLGVTSTVVEVAEVEKVGRYNERWRFKDPSTSKPRSFVAKEDEKTEIVYLRMKMHLNPLPNPPPSKRCPLNLSRPNGRLWEDINGNVSSPCRCWRREQVFLQCVV